MHNAQCAVALILTTLAVGSGLAAAASGAADGRLRAWVHIGPPKTGTSTLQAIMHANAHVLERHGIKNANTAGPTCEHVSDTHAYAR